MTMPHISSRTQVEAVPAAMRECLTFCLGAEDYGINLLDVQEIRSFSEPTRIANAPRELLGVVNLRGVVVPIIDMRIKLGFEGASYGASTVVIILSLRSKVVGVVVDSVSDVVQLEPGCIQPPPAIENQLGASYITGLATVGDRMLILADVESLLGDSVSEQTLH
jgi:purine-binding chemotaxis protein CheW